MTDSLATAAQRPLLATLRDMCLAYPHTGEDIKWDNPVFLVHAKIFVLVSFQADDRTSIWVKAAPGVQETFVGADPDRYFRPPYFGPKGWLAAWVSPESHPIWPVIEDLIDESFRLVAPKRVARLLPDQERETSKE